MLKERIEAMKESEKEAHRLMVLPQAQAYNNAIDDAAQLAQEADELMAEMVEAINDLREFGSNVNSNKGRGAEMRGCNAVMKYNQYKERTNDPIPDH